MLHHLSIASPAAPLIEVSQPGLRVRRQALSLQPGLLRIAQEMEVRGRHRFTEVSGPFHVFGLVHASLGAVRYHTADQAVASGGRWFGVFLPPYSVVEVELSGSHTFSVGFLLRDALPQALANPVVFRLSSQRLPSSRDHLRELLSRGTHFQAIARQDRPSPSAAQLKQAIDRSYAQPLRMARIARSLGRSPAAASRVFRKAYGLTPSLYRQSLHVLDSMMRLAEGQSIVNVAGEVGFGDLSRFYRNFRRIACTPPGPYLLRGSKNAKTGAGN